MISWRNGMRWVIALSLAKLLLHFLTNGNYWIWGYGDVTGEVILTVGISKEDLLDSFEIVERVATHHHEYAVPEERNVPICLCRGPKRPIGELWPFLKESI